MVRHVTQRELRNDSGAIMRALDEGDSFVVTRNGVPVAQLTPITRTPFVPVDLVLAAFRGGPHIDAGAFRRDVDRYVDQDPTPRA